MKKNSRIRGFLGEEPFRAPAKNYPLLCTFLKKNAPMNSFEVHMEAAAPRGLENFNNILMLTFLVGLKKENLEISGLASLGGSLGTPRENMEIEAQIEEISKFMSLNVSEGPTDLPLMARYVEFCRLKGLRKKYYDFLLIAPGAKTEKLFDMVFYSYETVDDINKKTEKLLNHPRMFLFALILPELHRLFGEVAGALC